MVLALQSMVSQKLIFKLIGLFLACIWTIDVAGFDCGSEFAEIYKRVASEHASRVRRFQSSPRALLGGGRILNLENPRPNLLNENLFEQAHDVQAYLDGLDLLGHPPHESPIHAQLEGFLRLDPFLVEELKSTMPLYRRFRDQILIPTIQNLKSAFAKSELPPKRFAEFESKLDALSVTLSDRHFDSSR